MKITFVHAGGFNMSGGDRVISIYASELQRRGHDVIVVTTAPQPLTLINQMSSLIRGRGWLRAPVQTHSHIMNAAVPTRILSEYRSVQDQDLPDADIVISTWWETAEWVSRLSIRKGTKVSFLQHYEAFPYTPLDRVEAVWRLPAHKIVISNWLADHARRFGDNVFSIVPNAVDHNQFHGMPRSRSVVPTVGLIYHPAPWKGFHDALASLEIVRKEFPDLEVVSFGASELPKNVLSITHFANPPQEKLREIYQMCDVWLCASHSEGFCLPLLESMACRTPVVSSRVGGATDIVSDGLNGYLADVQDVNAIAAGIKSVLRQSNQEWQKMSDNAYETAAKFDWSKSTDLFEDALRKASAKNEMENNG